MRESAFPDLDPGLLAKVDAIKAAREPGFGWHWPAPVSALNDRALTERELEVLALIAAGDSNGEIGKKLYISRQTVMSHVKHILDKLEARNRTHAVTCAFHAGLLPTSTEGTSCGN